VLEFVHNHQNLNLEEVLQRQKWAVLEVEGKKVTDSTTVDDKVGNAQ
jgi:hypothetical protein